MDYTATYSPEDNKLRLYAAHRLDPATYERVKAAGFRWAPKQELFVAPMWTPERAALLVELAGEIGDEDTSLVQRAEERAERFEDYSDKRAADAEAARKSVAAIADNIPMGQPILVGHHSEKHARRDAERIENGMRKAVNMWRTSEYWQQRAAGALRLAKYKERPDVRARRIKGLEADLRKRAKARDQAAKLLRMYQDPAAHTATLRDGRELVATMLASYSGGLGFEASREFELGRMMQVDALERAERNLAATVNNCDEWIEHYQNRLAYERAMLAESGGTIADRVKPEKGGAVRSLWAPRGGWAYIQKVNKVTVTLHHVWNSGSGKVFAHNEPMDKLRDIMTAAQVADARAAGRVLDVVEGGKVIGFHLLPAAGDAMPAPAAKPEPKPDAAAFSAMEAQLTSGVQVVAAAQLFPTPAPIVARMVDAAGLEPGQRVLEPSAGTGNILRGLKGFSGFGTGSCNVEAVAVEVHPALAGILRQTFGDTDVRQADFLACNGELGQFDRVLMNPPFHNGEDVKHILHAFKMLKPGGRLVAICADGPRQQAALRTLAEDTGGTYEPLPDGSFADQGTNVRTAMVVIER